MDKVKKRIFVDLFASPFTLIPIVAGLTMVILSWAISSAMLGFAGIGAAIIGAASFFTRYIFGLDKITKNAYETVRLETLKKRDQLLDDLDKQLRADKDPRPEQCLQTLRGLEKNLHRQFDGRVLAPQITDNFNRLFDICIDQIKESHVLWLKSKQTGDKHRAALKEERENIVLKIEKMTSKLVSLVGQASETVQENKDNETDELTKELEQAIDITKKSEQRLAGISKPEYDPREFESN